jgi:hypothetical protein
MAERKWAEEFYKSPDQHEGTCPVCNLYYVHDLASDRKIHRTFHRRVVDTFDPKPSIALAKLYAEHGRFIPVKSNSHQHARRKLANIARIFRREFGCDFTMYSEDNDPGDGFIIAEPDGRAIGGTTVRWIEFSNAPAQWIFEWIWVAPASRRTGLLKETWEMVREKYSGIDPGTPFSKGAATFFANYEGVSDRIRTYARKQLEQDNF